MLLSSALWPTSRVVAKWLHPAGRRRHGRCNCPGDIADQWEFDVFFFAKRKRKNQHSHTQSTLHGTTSTAESCGAGVFGAETSRVKFRSCWRKEIAVSQMHEFRANGTRGGLQKGSRKGCLKEWTLLPTCCSSLQVCWHHIAYVLDFALQKCMRFGRCWKVRALGFTLQDVCVRVGCKALWSPYVCRGQFWGCC